MLPFFHPLFLYRDAFLIEAIEKLPLTILIEKLSPYYLSFLAKRALYRSGAGREPKFPVK